MDWSKTNVLVTGGGSGIGLAIAIGLAREGCRVAISGRNIERLEKGAATYDGPHPLLTCACDVSDREDVDKMFAWFEKELGTVDILINSAGVNVVKRKMVELDPADFDRLIAINTTGAFNTIHAALPGMREKQSGLIINISSIAGKRAMTLAGTAYCAAKFAIAAMGTTIGLEERHNGIHVSNVYPGEVETPLLSERPKPVSAEKRAQMLQPEDVADCVVTIAKLPPRALVPELVITPLYQDFA